MDKSLKKSIYLGASALALVATLGLAATKADAATITSNSYMSTSGNSRNVNVNATGSNAIYTKAGILKGAKVVANKAKVAELRDSKQGKDNLRAYRVATTSRGTVYYKVVSFDKTVRGWIYGGTVKNAFGGGLVSYATTKETTVPSTTDTYKLSSTSATANTLLFREPAWTQYKAGRALDASGKVITSTDAFKDETFTLTKAVTTSREGDKWYQIKSTNTSLNNAWVKSTNVTSTNPNDETGPIASNQVRVTFVDEVSGKTIGSYTATKVNSESTPMDTLRRLSGGIKTPATATEPDIYYSLTDKEIPAPWYNLVTKLRGYSYDGLSAGSMAENNSALNTVTYGNEAKVKVRLNNKARAFDSISMQVWAESETEVEDQLKNLQPGATYSGISATAVNNAFAGSLGFKSTFIAPAGGTNQVVTPHSAVALIEGPNSTVKMPYSTAYEKLRNSLLGNKGEDMATAMPGAIKAAGLDDFYVVYDKTDGAMGSFVEKDESLKTGSSTYQIIHYTYTATGGHLIAGSGVPTIYYSIVAKNVSINQGDTVKPWSVLFGNN